MINVDEERYHKRESSSVVSSFLIISFFIWCFLTLFSSFASAAPILQIKPITWNVIGLDSNDVSTGPDTFPVGARVCNTGDATATNVTADIVFDSPLNGFIALQGNPTLTSPSLPSGASFRDIGPTGPVPNNCTDFYWNIKLTRNSGAYDTTQKYHVQVTADSLGVVSTPSNRELYVERLVSQNRNGVTSITGPTTVYVGNTYQYTVAGKTATGGYEQFVSFLNFPSIIFQILDVSATYSVPSAPNNINNATYADACIEGEEEFNKSKCLRGQKGVNLFCSRNESPNVRIGLIT
jgi:hypothetical protein